MARDMTSSPTPAVLPDARAREVLAQAFEDAGDQHAATCVREAPAKAAARQAYAIPLHYDVTIAAMLAYAKETTPPASDAAVPAGKDADEDRSADEAVDFVFDRLAQKLGLAEWQVVEGSEEWEGDVSATLHRLLTDAGIIDDETGAIASLAAAPKVASEGDEQAFGRACERAWEATHRVLWRYLPEQQRAEWAVGIRAALATDATVASDTTMPFGLPLSDADLTRLYEGSKRDALPVGSEVRQLVAEVRYHRGNSIPVAYLLTKAGSFEEFSRSRLTDADKADGWTETPLYARSGYSL